MNYNSISVTPSVYNVLREAQKDAEKHFYPYVTPEHVLYSMESNGIFKDAFDSSGLQETFFRDRLEFFFKTIYSIQSVPIRSAKRSDSLRFLLDEAVEIALINGENAVGIKHLIRGMLNLQKSVAGYLIRNSPLKMNSTGISLQ